MKKHMRVAHKHAGTRKTGVACVVALSIILGTSQAICINKWLDISKNEGTSGAIQAQYTMEELNVPHMEEPTTTFEDMYNSIQVDQTDAAYLANVTWGEARGCPTAEQAAVMWCVLNRVDSPMFPDDVVSVITQKHQFAGYQTSNPVTQDLLWLAEDVLKRWEIEKRGVASGRTLPNDYYFFLGDGKKNHFYKQWGNWSSEWDWSYDDPYKED